MLQKARGGRAIRTDPADYRDLHDLCLCASFKTVADHSRRSYDLLRFQTVQLLAHKTTKNLQISAGFDI